MNIIPFARAAGFGVVLGAVFTISESYIQGRRIRPMVDSLIISAIVSIAVNAIGHLFGVGALIGTMFGFVLSMVYLVKKDYLKAIGIILASGILGGLVEVAHVTYGIPLI